MVVRLEQKSPNFEREFRQFLSIRDEEGQDVSKTVGEIIAAVRKNGDLALREYTKRYDKFDLPERNLRISQDQLLSETARCPQPLIAALEHAAERIREYHLRQLPEPGDVTDVQGVRLGWRWTPISAVGMYVPGGLASYPSSVLMNAIPARVAGVERLVMAVPAPEGVINPAVLAAAAIAKIDEIYPIGGAQAVAALAYGTESIPAVDKIAGPGNAYVAEAKRQVFGAVGIDTIAGPSEICVVADAGTPASWIAADLLSQAEHDAMAQSILITGDAAYAAEVETQIHLLLNTLSRREIARASWEKYGAIILVEDVMRCGDIIDRIAPEHLELAVEHPARLVSQFRHAGAIFLGRYTPEAIGDYIAGPSHVLPTGRAARYSSGLSVLDFMKRSSVIACGPEARRHIFADAELLATAEGLDAHALSLSVRRQ